MDALVAEKTAFVTDEGVFYCKFMPFSHKNAGAIYERLINRLFKEHIEKTVEVYIDDMTIKSKKVEDHSRYYNSF